MLAHLILPQTPPTLKDAFEVAGRFQGAYNDAVATSLKRRIARAGGWHLIKRAVKLIPVAGSVFALGLAGYEIKKKGLLPGMAHVGLDVIPVVGATKNVIEIFTGDLIPDKQDRKAQNSPNAISSSVPQEVTQPS